MDVETTDAVLRDVSSWEDFTEALRHLHAACGSPTYESLAAHGGLAKSAISNLIGRNHLRRPTDSVTLKFVTACLSYAQQEPEEIRRITARWHLAWRRLASDDGAEVGEPTDETGPEPEPTRRPALVDHGGTVPKEPAATTTSGEESDVREMGRPAHHVLSILLPALMAVVAVAAMVLVTLADEEPTAATPVAPSGTQAVPGAPTCTAAQQTPTDNRLGRVWDGVFLCPNRPEALVFQWAEPSGGAIARLTTSQSWFACWTRGQSVGGTDVWYYTHGGETTSQPYLEGWGFVSASDVLTQMHPDATMTRECTFSTGPDPALTPSPPPASGRDGH